MQKPDDKLQKDFNKIGVFIKDKRTDIPKDGNYLSVHVEIGFPLETEIEAPGFDVMIKNQRGVETWFSDFRISEHADQKVFMFEAYQMAPDNVVLNGNYSKLYYMSYLDLCWRLGNNKIDDSVIASVFTEPRKDASHVDMGWMLPSAFVDSMTNALGMLSNTILSNTMIEALIYGPYFTSKE